MSDDPEQSAEFLLGRLANEQETNRKLRALLTRAADALEKVASYVSGDVDAYRYLRLAEQQLIAELRKAAQ